MKMWSCGSGGGGIGEEEDEEVEEERMWLQSIKHKPKERRANQSSGVWKYSQTPPGKLFQWVVRMGLENCEAQDKGAIVDF